MAEQFQVAKPEFTHRKNMHKNLALESILWYA